MNDTYKTMKNLKYNPFVEDTLYTDFMYIVKKEKEDINSIDDLHRILKKYNTPIKHSEISLYLLLSTIYLSDLMMSREGPPCKGNLSKYNKKTMDDATSVEKEHSNYHFIAKKIALDHLKESSDYYTHLRNMEKKM